MREGQVIRVKRGIGHPGQRLLTAIVKLWRVGYGDHTHYSSMSDVPHNLTTSIFHRGRTPIHHLGRTEQLLVLTLRIVTSTRTEQLWVLTVEISTRTHSEQLCILTLRIFTSTQNYINNPTDIKDYMIRCVLILTILPFIVTYNTISSLESVL